MKNSNNKSNKRIIDSYDYLTNSASVQDCTGLIPAPTLSEAEIESYNETCKFLPPLTPKPIHK